jgi:hypothetical protein
MEELQTAQYLTFHISSYGEVVNNSVTYSERYKPAHSNFFISLPKIFTLKVPKREIFYGGFFA